MFKPIAASLVLLSTTALGLAAPEQCLRAADMEAEQAIRFQTELMVMSDTCGQETYVHFATRNRDAISAYQHQMIDRFKRDGAPRAEARFDTYVTRLANQISMRAGAQPVTALCHEAADFLATADAMDQEKFRHLAADRAAMNRGEERRCVE